MSFLVNQTLGDWLFLCSILFSIGLYGYLTRTSIIGILMAVEIMLNSLALMFVSVDRFGRNNMIDGEIMSIFIIALAACEVVIFLAILFTSYSFAEKKYQFLKKI